MGDGFPFLDIIFFAMVAGFLVLRLRGVLGRRNGEERRRTGSLTPPPPGANDTVVPLVDPPPVDNGAAEADRPGAAEETEAESALAAAIARIKHADSTFEENGFIAGAGAAFEMILNAFANGDTDTLKSLVSDDVMANFAEAIDARTEAEETLESTLVGIAAADIIEASFEDRVAYVTVKFVSEQINVTCNADGAVVDGDPNEVTKVTDIWTFARNMHSRDPNWTLVTTRSPN